jgi:hypothetical protein
MFPEWWTEFQELKSLNGVVGMRLNAIHHASNKDDWTTIAKQLEQAARKARKAARLARE